MNIMQLLFFLQYFWQKKKNSSPADMFSLTTSWYTDSHLLSEKDPIRPPSWPLPVVWMVLLYRQTESRLVHRLVRSPRLMINQFPIIWTFVFPWPVTDRPSGPRGRLLCCWSWETDLRALWTPPWSGSVQHWPVGPERQQRQRWSGHCADWFI